MTIVYNLGLPRTGTTSVGEAVRRLGYDYRTPLADLAAQHFVSSRPFPDPAPSYDRPEVVFIATVRPREPWLGSVQVWRPSAHVASLEAYWEAHWRWLRLIERDRPLGTLAVEEGWEGLLHALSAGMQDGPPFPHLNRRAA